MNSKILINAIDPDECRIAKVTDNKLDEFYIDSAAREITRGNIYKGIVTRVEPGLQAAFVDYGGAWYTDQDARFGGDIGIGIRTGSSRSTIPKVGRMDIGYRFGDLSVDAGYYRAFKNDLTGQMMTPNGPLTVTNEMYEDSFLLTFSFAPSGM